MNETKFDCSNDNPTPEHTNSLSDTKEKEIEETEFNFALSSSFRRYCYHVITSRLFTVFPLIVIFMNTITLATLTFKQAEIIAGWQLSLLDTIFLSVYLFELFIKLYVWRIRYFKSGWNIFDFTIVLTSLVDLLITLIANGVSTFDSKTLNVLRVFRVVRALKALRVLRTIRLLKHLQIIVATLLKSIPAMGNIVILIGLVLYLCAIIGKGIYGDIDPIRFGNLGRASFTLFQLITLDDWFFVFSTIETQHPSYQHILLFLLIFIILETFIFINLFIAVIVDSLSRTQAAAEAEEKEEEKQTVDDQRLQEQHKYAQNVQETSNEQALAIEDYYADQQVTDKQMKLIGHYCALLVALEHNLCRDTSHRAGLDELVALVDTAEQ
ncbi:cation channel sperm-associated protein 1-like [Corticium candelabrum]|uniref:cation channel sperm-associated protein 1-like n=1 Tax=Corticium candelabrum TaxID=121492 RepID=UPI002E349054|nr:cation channel sperm-associated protein 1-like [Corticium candelabrum]